MRKCSHDLVKLAQLCSSRADGRYRIVTPKFRQSLRRINDLGIGLRYDLDFKTAYKAQTVSELYGDGPVSGVVLDDEFRRSTLGEVANLCERARRIRERRFEKHKGHTLSEGSRIEAYIRRLI